MDVLVPLRNESVSVLIMKAASHAETPYVRTLEQTRKC